ncbi:MAG: enoyl-CoA hydratase/isomerase family protein [Chitinophagaceae bacterium]|nr:enoyl-CoA hydratase/isomerase family protein [Oligoflexus sp.]
MTQYFKAERTTDNIQILRMGAPDKPVTVLGEPLLRELNDILDDLAERKEIKGLILISAKKDFALGADINEFAHFKSIDEARNASLQMHGILNKLDNLPFTTVAAIDGQALGGGLELALACDVRVISETATLALPEIQLGLIPGGGGTQRLPRLIGLTNGLDMILTGKRVTGKKAVKLGLATAAVHPQILEQVALDIVRKGKKPAKKAAFSTKTIGNDILHFATEANPFGRAIVQKKAREEIDKNTRGFYPAAYKALEAVFAAFDRKIDKGLELEAKLFGELAFTRESRSLIHLFHATTAAKRNPYADAGKKEFGDAGPELIGVVGSGFMGAGIATVLADKDVRVMLSDPNKDSTKRAMAGAYKYFMKKVKRGRLKPFDLSIKMAHLSPGSALQGFKSADLVIEAVFEDLGLKQEILAQAESKAHPKQVFASNTSALPISRIAAKAKHPERVLGMHFFSPVEKMPLLEIVVTDKTADWAADRAFRVGLKMGKQIIVVKDSPGFYTTRALAFFLAEASLLLEEGSNIEEIDSALTDFGFPVGPITLMDEVGIDVGIHVLDEMNQSFPDRVKLPNGLDAIQKSGRLGRKNGKGFFTYEEGKKVGPDESIYELMGDDKRTYKFVPPEDIGDRCVYIFINETIRCLEEGVLNHAYDGDIGAVFGLGFPPFLGGPLKYVDHLGAKNVLNKLKSLEEKFGARFAPAKLLQDLAAKDGKFFPEEN